MPKIWSVKSDHFPKCYWFLQKFFTVNLEVIYQKLFQERQQIFHINKNFQYQHNGIKFSFEFF